MQREVLSLTLSFMEQVYITEAREEYVGRFLGGEIGRHTWSGLRGRNKLSDLTIGREDDPHALPPHNPTNPQPPVVRTEDASQLDYMPLRDEFEVVCNCLNT